MKLWLERLTGRSPAIDNAAPLNATRFVVIDTELTSLDPRSNRVLSVGAIAMQGSRIRLSDQFYRVVNPGVELPERTILVHGLRPADVISGDDPAKVVADLAAFIEGAVLVGHFIAIDIAALKKEFTHSGARLRSASADTAKVYRWLEMRRRTYGETTDDRVGAVDLETVAKRYNIAPREAHHALGDAFVTAQLWQKLLHELESQGIRTVGALRRIA